MEELCRGCNLGHMISYDDTDGDGKLNVNEFYMAFSKLYSKYSFKLLDLTIVATSFHLFKGSGYFLFNNESQDTYICIELKSLHTYSIF